MAEPGHDDSDQLLAAAWKKIADNHYRDRTFARRLDRFLSRLYRAAVQHRDKHMQQMVFWFRTGGTPAWRRYWVLRHYENVRAFCQRVDIPADLPPEQVWREVRYRRALRGARILVQRDQQHRRLLNYGWLGEDADLFLQGRLLPLPPVVYQRYLERTARRLQLLDRKHPMLFAGSRRRIAVKGRIPPPEDGDPRHFIIAPGLPYWLEYDTLSIVRPKAASDSSKETVIIRTRPLGRDQWDVAEKLLPRRQERLRNWHPQVSLVPDGRRYQSLGPPIQREA